MVSRDAARCWPHYPSRSSNTSAGPWPSSGRVLRIVRWKFRRVAAQVADRVVGGPLFGFLFAAAPGGRESRLADLGCHLEALAVVGALLVEPVIRRRRAVLALGELLQQ